MKSKKELSGTVTSVQLTKAHNSLGCLKIVIMPAGRMIQISGDNPNH